MCQQSITAWAQEGLLRGSPCQRERGAHGQVLFGPGTDGGLTLSAVGAGLFRTYRYQDQALKLQTGSLGRKEAQNYTAHAWVVEGAYVHCHPCTRHCTCICETVLSPSCRLSCLAVAVTS